jgi:hypothetical protein
MSDYTKLTNFSVKDGYTTGTPAKVIKGTELDDEFNAIATAVATKVDSTDVLTVAQGGTNATTAAAARTSLGAAASGANSDITSLTGLTTALSVAQGGTGAATLTSKAVLVGNGTSAVSSVAPGASGNMLTSNGTDWVSQAGVSSVDSTTGAVSLASLASFAKSLGQNGYQKLPGGLIIQWGYSSTWGSVTFPLAFPSNIYCVVSTPRGNWEHFISSYSTTGFTPGTNGNTGAFFWIAVGN